MRCRGLVAVAGSVSAAALVILLPRTALSAQGGAIPVAVASPPKHHSSPPKPKPSSPKPKSSSPSPSPSKSSTTPTPSPSQECTPQLGYRGALGPQSWAQKRLGFTRVWQLTEGQGVTAAIVDSGAQRDHPMLSGRIADYVDLTGTGDKDCDGHGTGVASILGGKDLTAQGVPFTGVAPAVRLVVVKAQVGRDDANGAGRLAQGIRTAVDKGAKVVNVSVRASDTPPLRAAVQYAQSKGVLIVAAAGNTGDEQNGQPSYPAQYPGVLSVGALASDGSKGQDSGLTTRVDLSAPGENVETAWVGSGYNLQASGTSFAAPYVAGVAALVMSYHPSLTWQQVIHRLVATADGSAGDGTGAGMVDPVQAVTAVLPSEGSSAAIVSHSPVPVSLATPHPSDDRAETVAFAVSGGALLVGCCVLIAGVSLPMGRRREWRPGRPVIPEDDSGANGD